MLEIVVTIILGVILVAPILWLIILSEKDKPKFWK